MLRLQRGGPRGEPPASAALPQSPWRLRLCWAAPRPTPTAAITPTPAASWLPSPLIQVQKIPLPDLERDIPTCKNVLPLWVEDQFSMGRISASQGTRGKVWRAFFGCYNWGWGCADGTWWVESRHAGKHPTRHRTASPGQRPVRPQMSAVPRLRNLEDKSIRGSV